MKKTVLEQFRNSLITPLPAANSGHVIENLLTYKLPVKASDIWPYLSDTSRMNKELGFPPRIEKEVNGENFVSTKTLGRTEEWIEKPWVWLEEQELQNHREFIKGWMTEQRGVFKVTQHEDGCEVFLYFRWSFSNIFTKLLFSSVGSVLDKKFAKFFDEKVQIINSNNQIENIPVQEAEPKSPYESLLQYLQTADELDLDRLHLKKISHKLNLPLDLLLDVCQIMVKEGLLSLSWDVVCPHCRGVRAENPGLSFISMKNTCDACDIEFELELEEQIEVIFHVTDKLRKIPKFVYCAAEPFKKKHIKLHQSIPANSKREFQMSLKPGMYRLRGKGVDAVTFLEVDESSDNKQFSLNGIESKRLKVHPKMTMEICNPFAKDSFFTLEEAWWFHDRLMPREVLSNPQMRSMFSEDHLKIGVKLNIGNQVIMFTDIVGSTPIYKDNGDAFALRVVQEHYREVADIITSFRGVIVKYIGDAVMAAFLDLEDAYLCSVEIHKKFHDDRTDTPIRLRVSFHQGPVLCANMNVGIDYFGNTVNQAAKIQKWAGAFEIAFVDSDWKVLEKRLKDKIVKDIHDEKLNLQVKILKVA